MTASVGDELELELPETPPTGYLWQLADPALGETVAVERSNFVAPAGTEVGGGGARTLVLRLLRPGRVRLTLRRFQPWEGPAGADREFELDLDVR